MGQTWTERAARTHGRSCFAALVCIAFLAGSTSAWALANPAAIFCVKQGGKLRPKPDGRTVCLLPNGRAVDEWEYFRAHHKRSNQRR